MSFKNMENKNGDKLSPCLTPKEHSNATLNLFPSLTLVMLLLLFLFSEYSYFYKDNTLLYVAMVSMSPIIQMLNVIVTCVVISEGRYLLFMLTLPSGERQEHPGFRSRVLHHFSMYPICYHTRYPNFTCVRYYTSCIYSLCLLCQVTHK